MTTWDERAMERANLFYPPPEDDHVSRKYPLHDLRFGKRDAFIAGAAWQRAQLREQTSYQPGRFRDPEELARFAVEQEWALDSKISESGLADWRETLQRVRDDWDANTPGDIVSTIAAAIRLDRHFRAVPEGGDDA